MEASPGDRPTSEGQAEEGGQMDGVRQRDVIRPGMEPMSQACEMGECLWGVNYSTIKLVNINIQIHELRKNRKLPSVRSDGTANAPRLARTRPGPIPGPLRAEQYGPCLLEPELSSGGLGIPATL